MPLIPVYGARRRFVARDGAIRLEDFTFSFRRIEASRRPDRLDPTTEIRVDRSDVPAADLITPRGSRVVFARDATSDDLLVILAAGGAAAVELAPRDAIWAARRGEHGLWILRTADVASVEGGRS